MRATTENFSLTSQLFPLTLFILLAASTSLLSQDLPAKIQGYKVHKTNIVVGNATNEISSDGQSEAVVNVSDPELIDVSLSGITFSVSAKIKALDQSGKVDFLAFRDFRVNGIPVEIEKYSTSFSFKKNEPTILPKPAILFLPNGRVLKAAWKEITDSKENWTVTGRVFVFGKFRRMGFNFKRVVPIDIKLTVKNPLL